MTHIDCNVISDLLPLYIDKACSEQSEDLVESHLQSCEKCQKLYNEMTMTISAGLKSPELESKKIFLNACKNLFGIIIATVAMISCFVINANGAWDGGPADAGGFFTSAIYVIFWGVFSVISRKYSPLNKTAFVISLLTFISSVNGLIWRVLDSGGFISAFISVFASIPFYGLRLLMDWTGLYMAATVLSLVWLIYTGVNMRKLERSMCDKQQNKQGI